MFYTNTVMMLAMLLSLRKMGSLQNGVTPLFSMRAVSLVSLQSLSSIDVDARCKRNLKELMPTTPMFIEVKNLEQNLGLFVQAPGFKQHIFLSV